ncbi:hypothetical protein [Tropicibacter naphthalenivorans]|uniref:hypothetical protein n=1 Tax=Tropicibacter naphthalenivorans TaxID=441103 RepID=UPI00071C5176|nr:hypothetical protein [Tropicibacter naphthalenivorans]
MAKTRVSTGRGFFILSPSFGELLATDIASHPENLRWKKQKVLSALRDLFGMDVAFISRFTATERIFDEILIGACSPTLSLRRGDGSLLGAAIATGLRKGRRRPL